MPYPAVASRGESRSLTFSVSLKAEKDHLENSVWDVIWHYWQYERNNSINLNKWAKLIILGPRNESSTLPLSTSLHYVPWCQPPVLQYVILGSKSLTRKIKAITPLSQQSLPLFCVYKWQWSNGYCLLALHLEPGRISENICVLMPFSRFSSLCVCFQVKGQSQPQPYFRKTQRKEILRKHLKKTKVYTELSWEK